jgi:uracil-DNA glycosylase
MQNELFQSTDQPPCLNFWMPSNWPVAAGWNELVAEFLSSETGRILAHSVKNRIDAGAVIYPPSPFKALELTPLDQVRVVILGQDPYHGRGQAAGTGVLGRATGVQNSRHHLRNIFKETAQRDLANTLSRYAAARTACLEKWAQARRSPAQHLPDGGSLASPPAIPASWVGKLLD